VPDRPFDQQHPSLERRHHFAGTQNLNLGTGAVTLNATAQLTVGANTLTVAAHWRWLKRLLLTKAGTGTLALVAGANTYTGATPSAPVRCSWAMALPDTMARWPPAPSPSSSRAQNLAFNTFGTITQSAVVSATAGHKVRHGHGHSKQCEQPYSGATVVNGGTLQLGDGTSGHDSPLATAASACGLRSSLSFNTFGTVSLPAAISGSGSVTKSGVERSPDRLKLLFGRDNNQ